MEESKITTHKFSKSKYQSLISDEVCRTLRFDMLNLDCNMLRYNDSINPNCAIYENKEYVKLYIQLFPLDIGDELRDAIRFIFSLEELEFAYTNTDYSNIYSKLYHYFNERQYGNKATAQVICLMIDYRLNGYIDEEIIRAEY